MPSHLLVQASAYSRYRGGCVLMNLGVQAITGEPPAVHPCSPPPQSTPAGGWGARGGLASPASRSPHCFRKTHALRLRLALLTARTLHRPVATTVPSRCARAFAFRLACVAAASHRSAHRHPRPVCRVRSCFALCACASHRADIFSVRLGRHAVAPSGYCDTMSDEEQSAERLAPHLRL